MPKGVRNSDAMYGVSTLVDRWIVILRREKKAFQKVFRHAHYGGPEASLAVAQAWRDEIARVHPTVVRRERVQRITCATNATGIPGVRCRLRHGLPYLWMVSTVNGTDQAMRKSFSVGRYGEAARDMAIEERQRQLDQLAGRFSRHPGDQVEPGAPRPPEDQLWNVAPIPPAEIVRSTNKTGVSGVQCLRGPDGQVRCWVARTHVDKVSLWRAFFVSKHGEEEARALAVAERHQQVE